MCKIKKILRSDKLYYILSFLIPILILFLYIFQSHGNLLSVFISDLREQYIYLFDWFANVLDGKQSLFYDFNIGFGQNMIGTYAYYLSSPLNLLLYFIPKNYTLNFISILIFIKIGMCGLTMFFYLKHSNKNDNIVNLTFSLCYALMNFNILYYFNIMWLDVIFMTPIVLYGIDKFIKDEKILVYILSLFYCIISQYYMAYILCIFAVIYFFYKSYLYNKLNIKIFVKFAFISLIPVIFSLFLLIPMFMNLLNIYRDNNMYSYSKIKTLFHLFTSLGINKFGIKMDYSYPIIYCGLINLILLINFFINNKDKKEKISVLVVILIFITSLFSTGLIYIWHGFSYPVGLLHRFSFLFSLFIIIVSSNYFNFYTKFSIKQIIIVCISYILILFVGYIGSKKSDFVIIILNIVFLLFNIKILNIYSEYKHTINKISLLLIVSLELFINIKVSPFFIDESLMKNYKSNLSNDRFELYKKFENFSSDEYRIGMDKELIAEDELIPSNKGNINIFLSTNNKYIFNFLSNSGYYVHSTVIENNYNNYFLNSLLGVKYYYGGKPTMPIYKKYKEIDYKEKSSTVYKNDLALSYGYIVNENGSLKNNNNPFDYQNQLSKYISGEEIFFKTQSKKISKNKYEVETNNSEYIYMYMPISIQNVNDLLFMDIYINGTLYMSNVDVLKEIVAIKNDYKNQNITMEFKYYTNIDSEKFNNVNMEFYYDDYEHVTNILKKISENQLKNIKIDKLKLIGEIDCKEDNQLLVVTVPYDKNLIVKVDDKKISYDLAYDTFISFNISKGNHKVTLEYDNSKYYMLFVINILFDIGLLIVIVRKDKYEKKYI